MSAIPSQPDQNEGVVNWAVALDLTGGDKELLGEMVALFLEESATLLSDIRRAIDQGDAVTLRRSAHTLNGSLRIFDSVRAMDYAAQMSEVGKSEQLEQATKLLEQLESQMSLVIAELKRHEQA
jgi:HPt (histidine-containing phosphotransfer) domain-containing protein